MAASHFRIDPNPTAFFSLAVRQWIQWLTDGVGSGSLNDLGEDGPSGVEVIEADDQTQRNTPSGGTTLSDLDSGNLWNPTNSTDLPVNSWIVLRFTGTLGQAFQVFIQFVTNDLRIGIQCIPKNDWTTGGGSTSTPTKPATTFPSTIPNPGANFADSDALFSVADDGMAFLTVDGGTYHRGYYVGETDDWPGTPTYPFVCLDSIQTVGLSSTNQWNALSPVDEATELSLGSAWAMNPIFDSFYFGSGDPAFVDFHGRLRSRIGIAFTDASHQTFAGYLRYLWAGQQGVAQRATSDSMAYIVFNNWSGANVAVYMDWDGATAYS